jgi:hypothetical protein
MCQQFKYFAFISYNSNDIAWGKRLQRKLESYRMSATLCSERGWKRKPINPIFFAPTDIQPGGLTEELQERLKASRNLIVICSPHSAKSEWVGKEIEYFHQLGRTQDIHFFIVDGEPHSGNPDTECFNPIVQNLGLPEILGANIHEKIFRWAWLNQERAYVQLVSKLLNVEFDTIWQRHKRQLIGKIIAWSISLLFVVSLLIGVYTMNQPIDVKIQLKETTYHNPALPPIQPTELVLDLKDEVKKSILLAFDSAVVFKNIPHKYLNKEVYISANIRDFIPLDTALVLSENMQINIQRNTHVYGDIKFQLWDKNAKALSGVKIQIQGYEVVSDEEGYVSLFIPLEKQLTKYHIATSVPLSKDTITLPCGEDDVLIIK